LFGLLLLDSLGLAAAAVQEQVAAGVCGIAPHLSWLSAGLEGALLLVFGSLADVFIVCQLFCLWALMIVQGSLFPLTLLIQGACSLSFLFSKLVLLLIWSRDFVPFPLYCWFPALF